MIMKKGMWVVLSLLLTLVLAAGTAQAISIDFGAFGGTLAGSIGGVSGTSTPIIVYGTPPGFPGSTTQGIFGGSLNFSSGSLISTVVIPGGFTNTYGAGGSLSITGTATGGATGNLLSASFATPSTLVYQGGGGIFSSFLTNITVHPTLITQLFGPSAQPINGGNISFGLNPSGTAPNPTNFSLGIGSTNVVVATPEPASLLLLGSGLIGLGAWRWRKSHA